MLYLKTMATCINVWLYFLILELVYFRKLSLSSLYSIYVGGQYVYYLPFILYISNSILSAYIPTGMKSKIWFAKVTEPFNLCHLVEWRCNEFYQNGGKKWWEKIRDWKAKSEHFKIRHTQNCNYYFSIFWFSLSESVEW